MKITAYNISPYEKPYLKKANNGKFELPKKNYVEAHIAK